MKTSMETSHIESDDMLDRTAALTLQTCILNGLSLCITGIGAFVNVVYAISTWAEQFEVANVAQLIYNTAEIQK